MRGPPMSARCRAGESPSRDPDPFDAAPERLRVPFALAMACPWLSYHHAGPSRRSRHGVETAMLGNLLKPEFEELIEAKDYATLREAFSEMDPPDIAEVIEDLPPEDSGVIFRVLPRDTATQVFEYLPLDQQTEVVDALGTGQMAGVFNAMHPDNRARLFEELPAEVATRALSTLSPDQLKIARQLLGYPEGSAGRFMTPRYVSVPPQWTVTPGL